MRFSVVKEFKVGNYYFDGPGMVFRLEKVNSSTLYFKQIAGPDYYGKNYQGHVEFHNGKPSSSVYIYFKDLGNNKKVIETLYGK